MTGYVRAGQQQGAEVLAGEQALPAKGYFVRPTILSNVRPEMSVMREEIFGPVVCALRFGDEDLDCHRACCERYLLRTLGLHLDEQREHPRTNSPVG